MIPLPVLRHEVPLHSPEANDPIALRRWGKKVRRWDKTGGGMNHEVDLRKTIIFSLLAHGMAVSLFHVKIESPQPVFSYQSCRVSFLGSILDDYSFKMVPLGEIKLEHPAKSWFPAKVLTPVPIDAERKNSQEVPILSQPTLAEWNRDTEVSYQRPPPAAGSDFRVLKVPGPPFVALEGEIRERIVLSQPNIIEYFRNNENMPDSLNMSFQLTVSKDGIVQQSVPILSSGKIELDLLGMSYIRQWRFAPQETKQSGLLKIHLSKKP